MENDYSRPALTGFLNYVSEKGLVNRSTAQGWRVATARVLDDLNPPESADVRQIDVDVAFRRFVNKNPGHLSRRPWGSIGAGSAQRWRSSWLGPETRPVTAPALRHGKLAARVPNEAPGPASQNLRSPRLLRSPLASLRGAKGFRSHSRSGPISWPRWWCRGTSRCRRPGDWGHSS